MEHEQAINKINEAIKTLCEECDPKCPRKIANNIFPHCYQVHAKQQKLWRELFKDMNETEGRAFGEDAKLEELSWSKKE